MTVLLWLLVVFAVSSLALFAAGGLCALNGDAPSHPDAKEEG